MELMPFSWPRCPDGYELRAKQLIPRSDKVEFEDPKRYGLSVFRNFVKLGNAADDAVAFSDGFGLLLSGDAMSYNDWKKHHRTMLKAWEAGQQGDWIGLQVAINDPAHGILRAGIASDPDDVSDMRLVLEPDSLLQFMWVEMALSTINKVGLRACAWCGLWFSYGKGTNRRETARFCSNKCRKANHQKGRGNPDG